MQDTVTKMMIIRSLRDIADAINAVRQELRQLKSALPRGEPDRDPGPFDQFEMDGAFEPTARRKPRG